MEAKELRIGNYIRYRDEWDCEVESLGHDFATHNKDLSDVLYGLRCGSDAVEEYNGIPLTEEWLLKFGFVKSEYFFRIEKICFKVTYDGFVLLGEKYSVGNEIHHVHQLQNLYFSLTGEELTIR